MRFFAALPLPEGVVDKLLSLRLRLSAPRDGLRWSEPEQWHITLQFYGEVTEPVASCLGSELAGIAVDAPEIALGSLELFAAKGILVAAVDPSPALLVLQAEVQERSRRCGLVPESRPFRPHVTLARSKGKAGHKTLQALSRPALPALGPQLRWIARECLLMESVLRPQGAQYRVRSRVALGQHRAAGRKDF